jgi:hypothetical protein
MIEWFQKLWEQLRSLWTNLPEEDKEKIVNIIVASLTAVFKAFYHASKSENKDEKDNTRTVH